MSRKVLDDLRKQRDVVFKSGAAASMFDTLGREYGVELPKEHRATLMVTNGIEAYAGYVRLFGLGGGAPVDSLVWNRWEYWKFAWQNRCSEYWCFAETAWGDQYAYRQEELRPGCDPEVYFLDAISMTPEVVASSFDRFLSEEFLRNAVDPYDVMLKQARSLIGPLESTSHLAYVPSILLGGSEQVENIQKMNARAAMICNGDIATQLDEGPSDKEVSGVQTYEDEQRRLRLRLTWS